MVELPTRIAPLPNDVAIVDEFGRPTTFFLQQWVRQKNISVDIGDINVDLSALLDREVNGTSGQITGGGALKDGDIALALAASGVAEGVYGDGSNVPQLTVDAKGRVTSATTVPVSGGGGGGGSGKSYDIDTADSYTKKFLDTRWAALGSWVAVGASPGTVDMDATAASLSGSIYDLTTRADTLLVQLDNPGTASFRFDNMLDVGDTVVVKFFYASNQQVANNSQRLGIALNDNDASTDSGTFGWFYVDGGDNGFVKTFNGISAASAGMEAFAAAQRIYLRVNRRTSSSYSFWFSFDGEIWQGGLSVSLSGADNFWVWFDRNTAAVDRSNIMGCHWVKHVASSALDPF